MVPCLIQLAARRQVTVIESWEVTTEPGIC